jgi:hypothetical protein
LQRDQQIRINELLLQREELFLRIHAAETEASRLLGEPYPFTRPALPSDQRAKRKPGAPRKAVEKKSPADALRRLEDGETAYRVTYRQFSQTVVETHHDQAALATLLASQAAHLQVLSIETIGADGSVRACVGP